MGNFKMISRLHRKSLLLSLLVIPTFAKAEIISEPFAVQRILHEAQNSCNQNDGGKLEVNSNGVYSIDLNSDKHKDYIIDFHHIKCQKLYNEFCGTAGCDFVILMSQNGYDFIEVFHDRIISYDIDPISHHMIFQNTWKLLRKGWIRRLFTST